MRILLILVMIMTFSSPASGEFYKWVDENGKIQFSDTPPAHREVEPQEFKNQRALQTLTGGQKKKEGYLDQAMKGRQNVKKEKYEMSERTAKYLQDEIQRQREAATKKRQADDAVSRIESCSKLKGRLAHLRHRLRKANNIPYSNNSGLSERVWSMEKELKRRCSGL
jgi:hypothetical protein